MVILVLLILFFMQIIIKKKLIIVENFLSYVAKLVKLFNLKKVNLKCLNIKRELEE